MRTIVYLGSLLLLAGCNAASKPEFDSMARESLISIAQLKTWCDGHSSAPVTRDATICGQVVANDLYGEFLRTIVIQDDSGGISIAIEGERLCRDFPFGAWVEVRCNGLALRDFGGKILLGTTPDEYGNDEIPEEEINRHFKVLDGDPPLAAGISFDEVESARIDTRVRFDHVRFVDAGAKWCDVDPESGESITTERMIIDQTGNVFPVRTIWNCDYAQEPLPAGSGSLIGVIDYFGGKFSLRVTFREMEFPEDSGTDSRGTEPRKTEESIPGSQKPTSENNRFRSDRSGTDKSLSREDITAGEPPIACLSTPGCSDPKPTR